MKAILLWRYDRDDDARWISSSSVCNLGIYKEIFSREDRYHAPSTFWHVTPLGWIISCRKTSRYAELDCLREIFCSLYGICRSRYDPYESEILWKNKFSMACEIRRENDLYRRYHSKSFSDDESHCFDQKNFVSPSKQYWKCCYALYFREWVSSKSSRPLPWEYPFWYWLSPKTCTIPAIWDTTWLSSSIS